MAIGRLLNRLIGFATGGVCLLSVGCTAAGVQRFQFTRVTMGVSTSIVVAGVDRDMAFEAAAAGFARIAEIEQVASDYRPSSEVMQLCRGELPTAVDTLTGDRWQRVSLDLWSLLTTANRVGEASGGAFDVAVGDLSRLWRMSRQTGELPDMDRLRLAMAKSSRVVLRMDRDAPEVRMIGTSGTIDLGGVAKGFAARAAVDAMARLGVDRSMVSIAGDVCAGRAPLGEPGWRVQVSGDRSAGPLDVVLLEHSSISTSGDSEQSLIIGGRAYSHIIDPRTGLGTGPGTAVTAIGSDGAVVDAVPTAAVVMLARGDSLAPLAKLGVTLIVHRRGGDWEVVGDPSRVRWADR